MAALPRQPGQPPVAAVRARRAAGTGRRGVGSVDWINTDWPDRVKAEAAVARAQKFVGKSKLRGGRTADDPISGVPVGRPCF